MSMLKDICRICLQEANDQEIDEINLSRLNGILSSRPFISFSFLGKWQTELFRNHLICSSCIQGFRTIKAVYRNSYRANNALQLEQNTHPLRKINLRRLRRFSHIEGDFIVCRLCLKPTSQIAIYLYDTNRNILPMEYIGKMLKHIKVYMNFDRTINPILCYECWQNIQASYSFSKHLEVVTEKVFYYQALTDKIYIDREDLQIVLRRWDHLGVINIKTEVNVIIKNEIPENYQLELNHSKSAINLGTQAPIKNKLEYSFHDEHNYFKMNDVSDISGNKGKSNTLALRRKRETTTGDVQESSYEMPLLKPSFELEDNLKKIPKFKPKIDINIDNKTCNYKLLRSKIHIEENKKEEKLDLTCNKEHLGAKSILSKNNETAKYFKKRLKVENKSEKSVAVVQSKHEEESPNSSYRDKLRSVHKHEEVTRTKKTRNKKQMVYKFKKRKDAFQNKQKKVPDNLSPVLLSAEQSRPRTRLSTKNEIIDDILSQDLLVLRKEEIIKKRPQKRKLNKCLPKHTSTPKMGKNKQYGSVPVIENEPYQSNSNTEYTFETLNMDDEVQCKKEVIVEEELQIKREILSECESDDLFNENTEGIGNDDVFDDECPNLESFIKSEPPEESGMINLDEDEPPELEFQGPCIPIPMPNFTIQNTFTVDEKRHLIYPVDDKRNLLNVLNEQAPYLQSTVNMKGVENKINALSNNSSRLTSSQSAASDFQKANTTKHFTNEVYYDKRLLLNVPDKPAPCLKSTVHIKGVENKMNALSNNSSRLTSSQSAASDFQKANTTKHFTNEVYYDKRLLLNVPDKPAPCLQSTVHIKGVENKMNALSNNSSRLTSSQSAASDFQKANTTKHFINEVYYDKRLLLNVPDKPAPCLQSTVHIKGVENKMNALSNNSSRLIYSQSAGSDFPKTVTKEALTSKLKTSLTKILLPKTLDEGNPIFNQRLVVNVNKFDGKALTREARKKSESVADLSNASISSIANMETLPNTSFVQSNTETLLEVNENIDLLLIDEQRPYACKECDFSSTSHEITKAHISLHLSNSIRLHKCELCSFASTRKKGLADHIFIMHPGNSPDQSCCDSCKGYLSRNARRKCKDCKKVFHPGCVGRNVGEVLFDCRHPSINRDARKDMPVRDLTLEDCCSFCNQPGGDTMSCMKCTKVFHRTCLAEDRKAMKSDCEHLAVFIPPRIGEQRLPRKSKVAAAVIEGHAGYKNQLRVCDFCHHTIFAENFIKSCPDCNKVFHPGCLEKDGKEDMIFNCRHPNISAAYIPVEDRALKGDSCNFCKLLVKDDKVSCIKCNGVFHRKCFVKELTEKTLNCEHFVASPPSPTSQKRLRRKSNDAAAAAVQGDAEDKNQLRVCDFCHSTILKKKVMNSCPDCNKVFHPKCMQKDFEGDMIFKCRHPSISEACDAEDKNKLRVCDLCHCTILCLKKFTRSCPDCKKVFHLGCMKRDLKGNMIFKCRHPRILEACAVKIEERGNTCKSCRCRIINKNNSINYCTGCKRVSH